MEHFQKPEEKLRKDMGSKDFNGILLKMSAPGSHFFDHDSGKKQEEMLDIVVRRDKNAQSNFVRHDWIENVLSDALYMRCGDIYENIRKRPYENKFKFQIDVTFDDEVIGKGFLRDTKTNLIKEYTTDKIRLVIEADANAEYGFNIKSAFPTIDDYDLTKETHRDITPIMQKTHTYINGSPIKKAYLEYTTNPNSTGKVYLRDRKYDASIMMEIPSDNPNISYQTTFNGASAWMHLVDNEGRPVSNERVNLAMPNSMQTFTIKAPKVAKQIAGLHAMAKQWAKQNKQRALPSFCYQEAQKEDGMRF